jgi:heme exporter protein C
MNNYLKITAAVLIAYSILAGLLIPLSTGVLQVMPRTVSSGSTLNLQIQAYNAQFSDTIAVEARIRLNSTTALCASQVQVKGPNTIALLFEVPASKLPLKSAMENGKKSPFPLLEMFDEQNGYTSLESVLFIEQKDTAAADTSLFCQVVQYASVDKTSFPFLNILEETIRNLYYHVPMWFAMMLLLFVSVIHSILYLRNPQEGDHDNQSASFALVGVLFGIVGITTGAIWAKHTWGAYWSFDVKQNTSAIALLIYLAYFVLRSSFEDMDKRARVAAIYNIFAFATLIPLLYVIPRMVDSLHPGMGNNPAFSKLDLDNTMRMVFYPAVIGWILMGWWMATIAIRIDRLKTKKMEQDS